MFFFSFSFKQVELSRDNNLQMCTEPHRFTGVSDHQGPVERREEGPCTKDRVMATASLHSRQVLQTQRLTVKKGRWACPNSSRFLRKQSLCCLVRGGTDSVSKCKGRSESSLQIRCMAGQRGGHQPPSSMGPAARGPGGALGQCPRPTTLSIL